MPIDSLASSPLSDGGTSAPCVYICGAGPGALDLLTLRAYRLICSDAIDVVIYDRLVGADVLALIPSSVRKIYAGKACREHAMSQEEINSAMVEEARAGRRVLRLKGGDPLVFGRSGEEIRALADAGVPFEIIPGVTAASAAAAACGFSLTHREGASSVRFVTGHRNAPAKNGVSYHPDRDAETTFVVYMGLVRMREITEDLLRGGMPADTPCVAASAASLPDEKRLRSVLASFAEDMQKAEMTSPCVAIIGRAAGGA
ncbi:MAG: uroporphyrinogen-III C-methyltransferase [Rickettsiales bacterium]